LRLNQKRRAKKRLPKRIKKPLLVPQLPNQVWSADFVSDTLYAGKRFRTFNVIDDFNRSGRDRHIHHRQALDPGL
jgi:putative transposase